MHPYELTPVEAHDWAHSPIVKREKVSPTLLEETLENGKTYLLEKRSETRYQVVGIKN